MVTPSTASAAPPGLVGPRVTDVARTERLRGLVKEHFPSVWRFLRRLGFSADVVDDAAQDLFFVAFRKLDEITPGRERAFLFGAAVRIATHLKRKGAREIPVEQAGERLEDILEETAPTPETLLDEERARELLYQLLSQLDDRHRAVFVMYEIEAMTLQEIADVLEIPIGTTSSRLRTAREDFSARLERYRARARREGER